jgi:tetratricopeptide (TPR) repeat protein
MRHVVTVVTFSLLVCSSAAAQHASHEPLVGGRVPREIIERPVPLRTGIGKVKHSTSTQLPDAQAFYEQGLAYLHSFVWLEAARSFNQALRLDPKLALAWVGLSRAYSGLEDPKAAGEAQAKAKEFSEGVTPREERWIRLRTLQLESMTDRQNGNKRLAYVAALDEALEHDPQDAELWTLRGNVEEVGPGASGRGQRGGASSIVFYHEAIRRVPGHFGAHHYLIHSYEQVGLFEEALKHGQVYSAAASQVPHALHMYGHDLMKTGQMDKAIEIFGRARKLEQAYYEGEKILRDYDWHHTHNTALLALSHRHMGQVAEAQRLLEDAASVPQPSEGRASYFRSLVADLLVARGKNDEALEIAKRLTAGKSGNSRNVGNAIAARALVAQGKSDEARKRLSELPGGLEGTGGAAVEVDLARGEFLLRTGQREAGNKILTAALTRARRQRSPDGWIEGLFTLETIFHVARAAGDWDLARRASALLIEHDNAYGGSQFAAALVADRDGKRAEAKAALADAARLWKNADADHAPVREIRSR